MNQRHLMVSRIGGGVRSGSPGGIGGGTNAGLSTPLRSGRDDNSLEPEVAGRMPTVISKIGLARVRRRTAPRTSPVMEAMSPGWYSERGLGWTRSS